jgi:glyoxylase-like metal-dependent hydrolase (beta-lactamase superfamily II)
MNFQSAESSNAHVFSVAPGVWGRKELFVNFYIIQDSGSKNWALVDAGLKWSTPRIRRMADDLFGMGSRPSAIILTHGHFDHIGALQALVEDWNSLPNRTFRVSTARPYSRRRVDVGNVVDVSKGSG